MISCTSLAVIGALGADGEGRCEAVLLQLEASCAVSARLPPIQALTGLPRQ